MISFIIGKLNSSVNGVLIYKLDSERFDLLCNTFISLIIVLIYFNMNVTWDVINLIMICITFKYMFSTLIVVLTLHFKLENNEAI